VVDPPLVVTSAKVVPPPSQATFSVSASWSRSPASKSRTGTCTGASAATRTESALTSGATLPISMGSSAEDCRPPLSFTVSFTR
jgi:hypothetical protein